MNSCTGKWGCICLPKQYLVKTWHIKKKNIIRQGYHNKSKDHEKAYASVKLKRISWDINSSAGSSGCAC